MPKRSLAVLLLGCCLAGCLPSSCRRTESRAISPADSLSRQLATQLTPDTLRLAWQATGPVDAPMAYPRTVGFGPDGRLYVSDAEQNMLYVFETAGTLARTVAWDGAATPYLAGWRADTLLVFNPEARRLDYLLGGARVRSLPTPTDLPRGPLQYLTTTENALYFKAVGDDFEGYLARLSESDGTIAERFPLPGPAWRYAGLLRAWGDSLLSLSGFQPRIDVLPPGGTLDSMALAGFDSPMLRRTYAFLQGDAHEAPLLSTSAAPAGSLLFVLNLRPGWLRIDVYDRAGHLQHVLVQEDPGYDKEFYPMDLAVRQPRPGQYDVAVALVNPTPMVTFYRWTAP